MKKQLTFAAIAAIGALTLTACTAPAAEPGEAERPSLTMGCKTTFRFLIWLSMAVKS